VLGGAGLGGEASGGQAGTGEPDSTCGDGQLEAAEACDDGNLVVDDGCSDSCTVQYLIDDGHVDLFELTYDSESEQLVLQVKDQSSLYHLDARYRIPEAVVIDVDSETAAVTVPDDLGEAFAFLGAPGDTIYLLDQTQQPGLPWPGWSTQRLLDTVPAAIDVNFDLGVVELEVQVEGPGNLFTFMNDGSGAAINRYISTNDQVTDVILAGPSNHDHTSWVFTALGDYYLTVTPRLTTTNSGVLTGPPSTYRFHVGSKLAPLEATPTLAIAGGLPETQYQLHDNIELSVSQDPPSSLAHYEWYRWTSDGYASLPGQTGATLIEHAGVAGEYLFSVALLGRSRRIVASAATSAVVAE
jgi:surface-anchored protein